MASRGNRGGAGERVLESKHVIGLFMLMLVFSGVFFALGYVMGRNQYDGQVRAATQSARHSRSGRSRRDPNSFNETFQSVKVFRSTSCSRSEPSSEVNGQPDSDWGFYNAGKSAPDDTLKPGTATQPSTINAVSSAKTSSRPANVSAKSAE